MFLEFAFVKTLCKRFEHYSYICRIYIYIYVCLPLLWQKEKEKISGLVSDIASTPSELTHIAEKISVCCTL